MLGLSGGIDSALTATLAADTLGAGARARRADAVARTRPREASTTRGSSAANLGIDVRELPIAGRTTRSSRRCGPSFGDLPFDITEENLQARVRGTLLMALSNKFGWLVLATGNKSELSVGYSTLYGDMVGGFAPLKDVFKTRVYELARWRNALAVRAGRSRKPRSPSRPRPSCARARRTSSRCRRTTCSTPCWRSTSRRTRRATDIVGGGFDAALVERVCRMVDAAEYKRRQGPLGIKITPKAFGKDRRMPVTNRYRG